jgi:uncharacterized protein with von Willebrand factor type A (vWA) domain
MIVPAGGPDLADVSARFGDLLHAAGVPVSPERAGRFAAAVAAGGPATISELYWLSRVTMLSDHADIQVFDRVFAQVFRGLADPAEHRGQDKASAVTGRSRSGQPDRTRPGAVGPHAPSGVGPSLARAGDTADGEEMSDRDAVTAALSPEERLRVKDFADLTGDELTALRDLAGRLAFAPPPRRSRRHIRHRAGSELDVRATLRRAARSAGEPQVAVRRLRRVRPRRLVLLCDVSGSMEPYSRAYLQLLMSGVGGAKAEAFVFATRLTRLTRALRADSPALALERAGRAAQDWSGGTRIGESLKTFNDSYGRRGVARGAVVVVISDGWDSGDPDLLAAQMLTLRRLAHRVVWVNPRKAAPGFTPTTRGMAAALPHVDAFVSGHSMAAVDEVLDAIAGDGASPLRIRP